MSYPTQYLYTEEHEWVQTEGDVCTLGITAFAQSELGEVVYVELPDVGSTFDAGDEIGTIESVKAVAEVYTPVSGEIIESNADLEDAPETVNDDPHENGWLVKVRITSSDELDSLMSAADYEAFVKEKDDED